MAGCACQCRESGCEKCCYCDRKFEVSDEYDLKNMEQRESPMKPREFWIAKDPIDTMAFVYDDLESAQKRLESGLKRPTTWSNPSVIHVIEYSEVERLRKELDEAIDWLGIVTAEGVSDQYREFGIKKAREFLKKVGRANE